MESHLHNSPVATGWLGRMALSYRAGLLMVLLVAVLTHLPTSFGRFSTDDYLIRAMTTGDAALLSHGFAKADPDKPLWRSLLDGFHFYSPDAGTLATYREYGNLPWWTSDRATMNPFRPLAAFTHWLDFQIAPDSFSFQAFHTLLYVLLFAGCGYRLFWRISSTPSVALLASLLLIVDFSHVLNFNWIAARNVFMAGALGCAALERFLAWRQTGSHRALVLSLLLFATGLLTAEASVALGGYLFAYLLFVERCTSRRLLLALLPYGGVVVVWRLVYNGLGLGADGIGLYVDPGRSPGDFVVSAAQTLPMMLGSLLTTVDGAITSMAPERRIWMVAVNGLLVVACTLILLPLLRRNAWTRFMLVGSMLAAVPGAALISAGPRSGLFLSIGFFWLLAMWLHWLVRENSHRVNRVFLAGVLSVHLFLPALAGFLYTSQLLPVAYTSDEQFGSVAKSLSAAAGRRTLVVVNSPAPNLMFYLPFEWRYEHGLVPDAMNLLAPGLVSFDLKRLSAREFELVAPSGLPLDHTQRAEDLNGHRPWFSSAYSYLLLQGLFTSPETRFYPGVQRQTADLRITVKELVEGRPSRLRIEFTGREQPDDMVWQWYDWKTREYRLLDVPAVGATRHFAGPFDTQTEAVVKLCLNCDE